MQSTNNPLVSHDVVSAGVDWITATANKGGSRTDMLEYAQHQRQRFMDADESIKSGYRLGYYGWQAGGFFYGSRDGSSMIAASGAQAHNVFHAVSGLADNISRLDLQVTVATPFERPHLGVQAYQTIKSGAPSKVKVKNVTLITSQPQGETCSIGKRKSDYYGRIYDKATESQLGEACTLWRYEVELKRNAALSTATGLRRSKTVAADASALVWRWFHARGVIPIYTPDQLFCPQNPVQSAIGRDVLTWFETSLSITIGKAIKRHGLYRVMEALGLLAHIEANLKGD